MVRGSRRPVGGRKALCAAGKVEVTDVCRKKYRADIDGLRAIAVVAVVLFHAFPVLAPGGFVGVDIFFVISGFLITSLILDGLHDGSFTAVDFYARRIKRIFPALILVLVCSLVLGWLDMMPHEFRALGAEVVAGSGFWINITFWRDAGYFDLAGIQKPLLHLWSLAIEEQFYLLWPCIIVVAHRFGRRVFPVVVSTTVVSLVLSLVMVNVRPAATFYLLPTRGWELLAGACLIWIAPRFQAVLVQSASLHRMRIELPSALGVLLLIASFAFLDASQPFPGWRALPPVVGTMLLLCTGPGTIVNRYVLSHPILVATGLISYPLYLWHWPALSFPNIVGIDTAECRVIAILTALVLASATYLFVERKVRRAPHSISLILIGLMALVGSIGVLAKRNILHPFSASRGLEEISIAVEDYVYPSVVAQPVEFEGLKFWKEGNGAESVVFWGDSNAEMYFTRAQKLARMTGKSVVFAVGGGCPPIVGSGPNCAALIEGGFRFAATSPAKTIVMGAQWFGYLNAAANDAERSKMYAAIRSEVLELRSKGKEVFLILNIPIGIEFDPKSRTTRDLFGIEVRPAKPIPEASNQQYKIVSDNLKQIAVETGALTIDPFEALCHNQLCLTSDDQGRPAYKDVAHLRAEFVERNATFIDRVFE
jgi:peptidoglycan/LPS O-acetylase OafA/YrhL